MSNIVKTKEQIKTVITNWNKWLNDGEVTEDKLQLRTGTTDFDEEIKEQIRLKNDEFHGKETITTEISIKYQYAQQKMKNAIDVLGINYFRLLKEINQDETYPIEKIDEFFSNYKTTIYKYN